MSEYSEKVQEAMLPELRTQVTNWPEANDRDVYMKIVETVIFKEEGEIVSDDSIESIRRIWRDYQDSQETLSLMSETKTQTEVDGQLELYTTPEQATPPKIIDRDYGNMTITGALVTSAQFKAWVDYNRKVEMLFDIDETLGTGWMSPEHFQAFMKFAGDKRKCNNKTCRNHGTIEPSLV